MNRRFLFSAALFVCSVPLVSHAQTSTTPDSTAPATTTPRRPSPDQVLNMYANRLSLTDDQKVKLKPIIADRQQQMMDLRDDSSEKGRDKMKKMKGIMEDSDKRIKAILTKDQQKQYDALEAEQKEKMKERMQQRKGN